MDESMEDENEELVDARLQQDEQQAEDNGRDNCQEIFGAQHAEDLEPAVEDQAPLNLGIEGQEPPGVPTEHFMSAQVDFTRVTFDL